jgi:tRNA 2-thiouridine synthesizing protein E
VFKAGINMQLALHGRNIELDKEGFLINLDDWNEEVASIIAQNDQIQLTQAHWEIINLVREFYQTFQVSPSMRALVKRTGQVLGEEKGKSIYLLKLFPVSPARYSCKIAGLPKPANCL